LRPPKSVSLVERRTRLLRRPSKGSKPLELTPPRPVQRERRPSAARAAGSDAHGTVNHASELASSWPSPRHRANRGR
jgi:hypothetical protein